jgi:hypothetical protein
MSFEKHKPTHVRYSWIFWSAIASWSRSHTLLDARLERTYLTNTVNNLANKKFILKQNKKTL